MRLSGHAAALALLCAAAALKAQPSSDAPIYLACTNELGAAFSILIDRQKKEIGVTGEQNMLPLRETPTQFAGEMRSPSCSLCDPG